MKPTADEIIDSINNRIEQPFVSAKFGDQWKSHTQKLYAEGSIETNDLIDMAWKQGRRALMLEAALRKALSE